MSDLNSLDVYRSLCEQSSDALYVVDLEEKKFVLANAAFERISGYTRDELTGPGFDPLTLFPGKGTGHFPLEGDPGQDGVREQREAELAAKTGEVRSVEITAVSTPLGGKRFRVGSIRDVSDQKELEAKLKEEVGLHRRNTIEAAKSSVRIYQLTEKIRNVPRLVTALLNADSEEELFRAAAKSLCEKMGLAYAGVSFYLSEPDALKLCYSTTKKAGRRHKLDKPTRHTRAFKEGKEHTQGGTSILPLKSRDAVIGLMEVQFDENEKVLFDESESVKQGQSDIVRTIAHMLGLMIENLRLYDTVRRQSIIDELTQTYNRRYFDLKLTREFQRAMRYRRDLSMIIIDLDNFKEINDTYGHPQGDLVLREVAQVFKKSSRDVDTICRYGGDEFILLLPETNKSRSQAKAENLRRAIESHPFKCLTNAEEPLFLSISIGVSSLTPRTASQDDLFRAADTALYDAKKLGRNLVCTADE